ncbi:MAG: exodeoxyribonuclease VII small subunit [Anaerolineae bacterium]
MTVDIEKLSFEEAFRELEETVHKLEAGDLTLEESITLFERGMQLANYCSEKLDKAELKINQLVPGDGDEYEVAPFSEVE